MNAVTLLEKVEAIRKEGGKEQILKELNALLITFPIARSRARSYIEKAIEYIEKH